MPRWPDCWPLATACRRGWSLATLTCAGSRKVWPIRQRLVTWLDSTTLGDGCGLACVETARGTLLHQIQLDGDRIGRYVIVAPTEWNFHPQGSFVREIDARPAANRAKAVMAARRLVLSLDPCVACELRIRDA
jgi:Ni,Fe-hydrogenase I large subunit